MKTNLLHSLKSNAPAGEKRFEPKSELTILLLLFVALAGAGCETLESGPPGAVAAPSSPWPAAATGSSAPPASQTGFASALNGQWYHDGKPTSIRVDPDGRHLTIIDENGFRTNGVANSPMNLTLGDSKAPSIMEDDASHGQMAELGRGNHIRADLILVPLPGSTALADGGITMVNQQASACRPSVVSR
jgi:hypothetical protein